MSEEFEPEYPEMLYPTIRNILVAGGFLTGTTNYCLHRWPKDEEWWVVAAENATINDAVYIGPSITNALWYLQHPTKQPPFRADLQEKE
jgi:hypothetical protein